MQRAFPILLALLAPVGTASAATLGTPIFATAPAMVFVTNQFGPDLLPTDSYTIGVTTTIATAEGAPELVGQSLAMSYFVAGGFDDGTLSSFAIGGTPIFSAPSDSDAFFVAPPYVELSFDPVTMLAIFAYDGVFAGFGPREATFPEIELAFALDAPLPTKDGFLYCQDADTSVCDFSNIPGLTELFGEPASLFESFTYTEGAIDGATLTFATVGGRPPAPVPLPASAWLLLGGAGALAGLRRATRPT